MKSDVISICFPLHTKLELLENKVSDVFMVMHVGINDAIILSISLRKKELLC